MTLILKVNMVPNESPGSEWDVDDYPEGAWGASSSSGGDRGTKRKADDTTGDDDVKDAPWHKSPRYG